MKIRLYLIVVPAATILGGCVAATAHDYIEARRESEETGICYVHHREMLSESAFVRYGTVAFPFGEARKAQEEDFPFAYYPPVGSPTLNVDGPLMTNIYVCSACERARARWIERHPTHPWAQEWKTVEKPNPERLDGAHPPY